MLCTKHWSNVQNPDNCCICLLAGMSRRKTKEGRWNTYCIKHLFGMSCRQTESGSGLDDGGGREAHNHNTDVPLQHLTPKRTARENKSVTIIPVLAKQEQEGLRMVTHTGFCWGKAVRSQFGASTALAEMPDHKSLFKIQSQGGPSQTVSVY